MRVRREEGRKRTVSAASLPRQAGRQDGTADAAWRKLSEPQAGSSTLNSRSRVRNARYRCAASLRRFRPRGARRGGLRAFQARLRSPAPTRREAAGPPPARRAASSPGGCWPTSATPSWRPAPRAAKDRPRHRVPGLSVASLVDGADRGGAPVPRSVLRSEVWRSAGSSVDRGRRQTQRHRRHVRTLSRRLSPATAPRAPVRQRRPATGPVQEQRLSGFQGTEHLEQIHVTPSVDGVVAVE